MKLPNPDISMALADKIVRHIQMRGMPESNQNCRALFRISRERLAQFIERNRNLIFPTEVA